MTRTLRIGVVGKYVAMPDAYLSVVESVRHAGFALGAATELVWMDAEKVPSEFGEAQIRSLDGLIVPGGFGERGIEGMIAAARICREHAVPYLGICLGMQIQVIEFARHVLGMADANSTEFDKATNSPVIDMMADQLDVTDLGGTQRLGSYPAMLEEGSAVAALYGSPAVSERHRHRYEFNPRYREAFLGSDLRPTGMSPDGRLVEFVELRGHPFMVGTQAHPEFKSRPNRPHPLFVGLISAALQRSEDREPHILDPAVLDARR